MPKTTSSEHVYYALQLYSSGLYLRKTSERLTSLIKRNHVSVWNWIQKYRPKKILKKRKTIAEFIVDETLLKVGNQYAWLWVAIEPVNKVILGIRISFERNMLTAEQFLKSLVKKYGKHPLSTDGGTWYPQACNFLKITHHLHSVHEKSIIERTIQYIKDRTESFDDDYFPCRKDNCKLMHITNWLKLFVDMYNQIN